MSSIKFKVNGEEYTVGSDVSSDVMLVDYLRNYLELRGTKYSCREGGCGVCIVTVQKTPGSSYVSVNSCLTAIGLCHGWNILTIEGLGNKKDGYHPLQLTLAETHGTQCGYCSPGWVMAMHGLLEQHKDSSMLELEKGFGSNLCRCTGYRPIVETFKKFGKDAPKDDKIMALKQLSLRNTSKSKCCRKTDDEEGWCMVRGDDYGQNEMIKIELKDGRTWYRPTSLSEVYKLLEQDSESYMLMAGNTAHGAVPIDSYPRVIIDVSSLQELRNNNFDQNLIVGAGLTLTEFMDICKAGSEQPSFKYLEKFRQHLELVGHLPVRNTATIAGNLMIKNQRNGSPSDLYLLFEMVGAQLSISDYRGVSETVTMQNFLTLNMRAKVILNVLLPPLGEEYKMYTYKLMPRAQSTHAIVNAGFMYKIDLCTDVVQEARIVYGGLSARFLRAPATESYLLGKPLFTNETLQGALRVLDGEMIVDENPPEPSAKHRRYIAKALFFKGLLNICPPSIRGPRYESGIINLHESRGLSSSKQSYPDPDNSLWPNGQPMPKIEGQIQCSGEAMYTDDYPSHPNEVFGAFVLSTVGQGTILKMDPSQALALEGVLAFFEAKDIPGINTTIPVDGAIFLANEEALCDGTVKYHSQPLGIIVAESQYLAEKAAKLVTVEYSNVTKPIFDVKEAKTITSRNTLFGVFDATSPGTDIYKTFKGTNVLYNQYHAPMETIVTIAKPSEEGLEVHISSQWLDGPQVVLARALNMQANKIDIHIRRVGGSYGLKITRCNQAAVAAGLVALKMNRPCRFIQPLTTNLRAMGKRMPNVNDYEVAVNSSGVVQYINSSVYTDNGYIFNEPAIAYGLDVYYNAYHASKMSLKAYNTVTDTPSNTFCRAPGTLEQIACMEIMMERISYELSMDPLAVRLANVDETHSKEILEMAEKMKVDTDFTARKAAVDSFNTQNRWKKRGLRWAFCRWEPLGGIILECNLSVYHEDGTVVITHGAVEMGQGINTKAVQIAAHLLQIPVSKIQIKANNTIISPNCFVSAASLTAEGVIISLRRAIQQLQARLEPVKATLTNPTWEELITAAYTAQVDLQAHGFVSNLDAQKYQIYGMALTEVELDVLTGEFEILRVDILQDVGYSISPYIDMGQVEGGFMMALGYWTCEKVTYNPENGAILTDRFWDYHLPEARDIPQDFRVSLKPASYSNDIILGSKAVGEPSTCLGICIPFAIRDAMAQARQESGIPTTTWFEVDGPFNGQNICDAIGTNPDEFKYY